MPHEPIATRPFSPRGEGAGRRMRGTPEDRDFRLFHPLIRPFGPPSPRRGEGKSGIGVDTLRGVATGTNDHEPTLPLRMRISERIASPVTMTTAISPSVSVPRKSTMMTFTTLAPWAIVLE